MRNPRALALFLTCMLAFASVLGADRPPPTVPSKAAPTPGVELAQTISMITGVAISPLVGVSAVGAWKYFKTPGPQRASLPWFAQPWFWLPALLLVTVVFAKDALGPVIPTALKKPFDMAELFENKLSALVAAGAFVPLVISVFPGTVGPDAAATGAPVLAAIDFASLGNLLLTPFALAAFAIVWLASHAINILIFISPFGTVDAGLKALRLFLLSTIAATAFVNPYVGAAWALLIILVCYFLAGWSFRMLGFGTVFAWDTLTRGRKRYLPGLSKVRAFTSRTLQKVPIRTYGWLGRDEQGRLVFQYRPWLILRFKTIVLPACDLTVGRGFLNPTLLAVEGDAAVSLFTFPPRCRSHEESLLRFCGAVAVRDVGLRGIWRWLKELCGWRSRGDVRALPAV